MEVWRTIAGFRQYEASSLGNVRKVSSGRMKVLQETRDGYLAVSLFNGDGKAHRYSVHKSTIDLIASGKTWGHVK